MKKTLLALAFVAGSISLTMAQPGQGGQQRSPEERAKQQTERLSERLKLNADQKSKVEAILLAQGKSMDSLRNANGQGGDRQQMWEKTRPIREQADQKINAVLTEDQKKEYVKAREEMRGGRRGGQGGPGTPPPAN